MTFLSVLNAVGQPANQSESPAVIAVFLCVPRWNRHTGCPCLALIYHWCYANIAGHGYSAVDHTGLRHCSGRGWVCGLKGWPAPPPTHSTVVKGCWLKHEFRKATRHTRWFIRLLHWLCVCLFFLNIVFSYYLLFGFMATMIKYSLLFTRAQEWINAVSTTYLLQETKLCCFGFDLHTSLQAEYFL